MQPQDLKDDYFKQQPYETQLQIANTYFDEEIADDYYKKQTPEVQQQIRQTFLDEEGFIDKRIELANQMSIDSQMVTPEDGTATAPMPSMFPNQEVKPISLGSSLEQTYRGNIDLDNRPLVDDGQGNYMTEHSITMTDDQGVHWIIPTIVNGKKVSNEEAWQHAMQTGEHLGQYHNLGDAERAAEQIHLRQQDHYKGQAKSIKAIKPFVGMIDAADKHFNQDLEHYKNAPADSRIETAFDYFKENIGEDYAKLDDEDRMTVLTAFFDQVVKPRDDELQNQHNMLNMFLKFADKALYTITDNKDYDKLAQARQYMQDKDKTVGGAVAGMAGSALPYVAVGLGTGMINGLAASLVTDSALQGTLTYLEHARDDAALSEIATDVAIDTGVNLVTFGLVRKFAAGNMAKGDYDKAAQQLFGKNADELDPQELAKFKEVEAKSKLRVAKESKDITPEQKASIDEATDLFNKMAADADPRPETINVKGVEVPSQPLKMKEAALDPEIKPEAKPEAIDKPVDLKENPLYYEVIERAKNRYAKDTQNPNIRVMDRTVKEQHNGKEWENVVNKELDVPNHNFGFQLSRADVAQIKRGNITPEIEAKIKNDIDLMESDPKWAKDVEEIKNEGTKMFAIGGGNAAGGAMGGATLGGTEAAYEDMVEGKDLTTEDYLKRIFAGAMGGAVLGKKYGGKGGTKMFVGAKYNEEGAFSNIYDDGIRRWIDDSKVKVADVREGRVYKLSGVIDHPELFEKYPDLKDLKVYFRDIGAARGRMVNAIRGAYIDINPRKVKTPEEIKSVLLHEIQHSIQTKEGWATGGSVGGQVSPEYKVGLINDGKFNHFDDVGNPSILYKAIAEIKRMPKEEQLRAVERLDLSQAGRLRYMDDPASFYDYKRLAGEQEARAVQAALKHPNKEPYQALKAEEGSLPDPIVRMEKYATAMDEGLPTSLNDAPVDPSLITKAAKGDKDAFDEVAGAVFSRTFERIIGKNTGDQLKPMVLDKLVKNPDLVEEMAAKFGYKIRYFSSNPDNVGRKIGKTVVEERPANRNKLKKQGYQAGNIWVYDPYDTHGAFNDPEYTKAWRGIHELSHAITERMMQAKYGDSRRFGALGIDTKNPYDPTDPRTYKALTAEEAQRAIEWEDVAFRTQVKLLDSMGIKVNEREAINDFNIAGSDTIIRTLTGDFSDPADFGVMPRKDTYKIDVKKVLQLLENQEKELARHQGRLPSRGIDLNTWKQVTDQEIEAVIKDNLENPLVPPKAAKDSAQISIEAVAGEEVAPELKEMIQMLSHKDQAKYHEEMYKALTDQSGTSIIAKKLGLEVGEYNNLAGVWKGEVNPSAQIQVKAEMDGAGNLTQEFKDKLDDMAEMYAVAFKQDGVGWHYPMYKGSDPVDQNGIELMVGKKLSKEQAVELEDLLFNELGDGFVIASTEKGARIFNVGKASNTDFHQSVRDALANFSENSGKIKLFRTESNLVEGVKRGDNVGRNSLKRRPDLQEWFNTHVQEQVERVNKRFTNIARENGYIPKPEEPRGSSLNPLGALRFLAEDIPLGILNGADAAVRGIQKAIFKGKTIDEAVAGLLKNKSDNHIIDTIKKAVVQDYRLSDQYLALADKANVAVKRGEAEASKMFDALKDLDEDDLTALHNFVAGESKEIPSHLNQLAVAGKKAILAKTKELVSLGLLPEDILKAYKDGYLHREYEKHLRKAVADMFFAQQKKLSKQYKRGKEILVTREEYNDHVSLGEVGENIREAKYVYGGEKNGKIILRRDWTAQERAEMGEITNAAYTVPSTIMKLQRDVAYGKFLAEVATDPKLKGVVKTAEEMKGIAGVTRVGDIPRKGTGYQLLSGSQYGKLDGMYVEDAVANDIRGFKESLYGDEKEIMEAWKSLLTEWKVAKTVKNPTAHMNNFLSNMVMSYYAGIAPSKIGKNTVNAINEIKNGGAYFQEAEEIGLLGRSKLEEIRRVVDKPAMVTRSTMNKIARNIYMAEDSKLGSAAFKMYSLEDDVSRLALYMHYRKEGKTIPEAMKLTSRVVFDYTKRMPPLIRGMRDTGLVPFISWTYKAIPLMFNTMFQRPSRYAALVGLYALLDNQINDGAEKPEFMRGKYMTLHSNSKDSMQLRVQSMTPYFDWITEPIESVRQLALGGVPQKAIEGLTNRQFWNDQKISYREGLEKAADYGLWTFNSILPTPAYLGKVYNVGEAVANDGKQVRRNKLFEPRSTAEAAAGLFGFNVRTYNKHEQKKRSIEEKRKELRSR